MTTDGAGGYAESEMSADRRVRLARRPRPWADRLNLMWLAVQFARRTVEKRVSSTGRVESWIADVGPKRADRDLVGFASSALLMWTGLSIVAGFPLAFAYQHTSAPLKYAFSALGYAVAGWPAYTGFVLWFGAWALRRRQRRDGTERSLYYTHGDDRVLMLRGTKLAAVIALVGGIIATLVDP